MDGSSSHEESPGQSPKPKDKPEGPLLHANLSRRNLLRGALAAGVAIALPEALLAGDSRQETQPYFVDQSELILPPSPTETYKEKLPYDPTPNEIGDVIDIFNQPTKEPDPFKENASGEDIEKARMKRHLEAAKRHNLTLFDWLAYSEGLSKDAYNQNGPKLEFSTYLTKAQEFLKRYDIDLSLGEDQTPNAYSEDGHPLDKATLEKPEVKQALVRLINEIGDKPVELIKEMGLKKIIMIDIRGKVKVGDKEGDVAGYADVNTGDTYYFDPRKLGGIGFMHEAYHLYDANHADTTSMYSDKTYRALNPPKPIYLNDSNPSENNGQYISAEAFIDGIIEFNKEYYAAKDRGDTETMKRLQSDLDAKAARVVVATDYAFADPAEDKAELGSEIINPFFVSEVLDPKKPILRKKALFLLARLYHDNPNIVKYIADTRISFTE